jgi:hypothetical protein
LADFTSCEEEEDEEGEEEEVEEDLISVIDEGEERSEWDEKEKGDLDRSGEKVF